MVCVNVLRKDVSNDKKKVIWVRAKALSTERYNYVKLNRLSATETLSLFIRYGRVQRVETILSQWWLVMGTPNTVDNLFRDWIKIIKSDTALLFLIALIIYKKK